MSNIIASSLDELLSDIKQCRLCESILEPNPVLVASQSARLLIIGQAPGTKVHATGIPWNDPSGDRLRNWLQLGKPAFYDATQVAIIPAGFCYPGKGNNGDLPPPPICAKTWHPGLMKWLEKVELTLLVGQYAQRLYLKGFKKESLSETVRHFEGYLARGFFPLPHPSPRNTYWLQQRPWFENDVLPALRARIAQLIRNA